MKLYIRAMSEYDSEVRRQLVNNSKPLYKHLIKIALYPTSEYVTAWTKEIYAFINDVDKLKRTKKFPTADFIFKALSTHLDVLDVYTRQIKSDLSEISDQEVFRSGEDITDICTNYAKWLASELSTQGGVTFNEVKTWIDSNILQSK